MGEYLELIRGRRCQKRYEDHDQAFRALITTVFREAKPGDGFLYWEHVVGYRLKQSTIQRRTDQCAMNASQG